MNLFVMDVVNVNQDIQMDIHGLSLHIGMKEAMEKAHKLHVQENV